MTVLIGLLAVAINASPFQPQSYELNKDMYQRSLGLFKTLANVYNNPNKNNFDEYEKSLIDETGPRLIGLLKVYQNRPFETLSANDKKRVIDIRNEVMRQFALWDAHKLAIKKGSPEPSDESQSSDSSDFSNSDSYSEDDDEYDDEDYDDEPSDENDEDYSYSAESHSQSHDNSPKNKNL